MTGLLLIIGGALLVRVLTPILERQSPGGLAHRLTQNVRLFRFRSAVGETRARHLRALALAVLIAVLGILLAIGGFTKADEFPISSTANLRWIGVAVFGMGLVWVGLWAALAAIGRAWSVKPASEPRPDSPEPGSRDA
jgi:hypothetical protein